jgi:hypothetical protein
LNRKRQKKQNAGTCAPGSDWDALGNTASKHYLRSPPVCDFFHSASQLAQKYSEGKLRNRCDAAHEMPTAKEQIANTTHCAETAHLQRVVVDAFPHCPDVARSSPQITDKRHPRHLFHSCVAVPLFAISQIECTFVIIFPLN